MKRQQTEKERSQKRQPSGSQKQGSVVVSQQKEKRSGGQQRKLFKKPRESYAQTSQQMTIYSPPTTTEGNENTPTCFNYRKPGHWVRDCPLPLSCRLCGAKGHMIPTCPQAICNHCRQQGHTRSKCPQNSANPQQAQTAAPSRVPSFASYQGSGANRGRNPGNGGSRGGSQGSQNRRNYQPGQTSQAQNYALPQPQTQEPTEPIHGIIPFSSTWAHVLFDTGASRSFISEPFANKLQLDIAPLTKPIFVDTPGNNVIPVTLICRKCSFVLGDHTFEYDFIVFNNLGFDLIFGIDWLSNHQAIIGCENIESLSIHLPGNKSPTKKNSINTFPNIHTI